jgi:glycosyltransferase involved in cell wall biosynthesis
LKLVIAQSNLTLYGGAEKVVLKIAQHYDAKIYTAEYNSCKTFPGFKELDIEIISTNALSLLLPYGRMSQGLNYGLSFSRFRIKEDYDVINAHMAPSHWIRNRNERVLWYCHTPPRDVYDLYEYRLSLRKGYAKPIYAMGVRGVRAIDRYVVRRIESILANSTNTKSRIEKYYKRADAQVLGGGIDYKQYKDNGDGRYFLYPTRFSPNKRQEYAIKAFEIFKRKKKGYRLVLCGSLSKDKQFYSYYNEIVKTARSVGDVQILTDVSEQRIKNLFSRATAVLYPPMNEDYGLVPLEAMASGKVPIAVNEGGPKDTISEGKTGFLVESAQQMAERMLYLADHPRIAGQMSKKGIETVKKNHSWEAFFRVFDKKARELSKKAT